MKKSKALHIITTVKAEIHVDRTEGHEPESRKLRYAESDTPTGRIEQEKFGCPEAKHTELVKQEAEKKADQQTRGTTFVIGTALTQTQGHRQRPAKDVQQTRTSKQPGMDNIEVFEEKPQLLAKSGGGHKLLTAIQKLTASTSRTDEEGTACNRKISSASSGNKSSTKRTVTVATHVVRQMKTKTQQDNWTTGCEQVVKTVLKEHYVNTDSDLMKQDTKIMSNQGFNKLRNTGVMATYESRKRKHVHKKCTKKKLLQAENETTNDQPKETDDKDSSKQKEKMNFYKATRCDKPGDFLLHPRGGSAPTPGPVAGPVASPVAGPVAETQTEAHSRADSSSEDAAKLKQNTAPAASAKKRSSSIRSTVTVANYVMRQMKTKKEKFNWSGREQVTVQKQFPEKQVNKYADLMNQGKVITSHDPIESVYWDRYNKYDVKTRNERKEEEDYFMIPMSKLENHKEKTIREVLRMYGEPGYGISDDIMKSMEFEGELPSTSGHWIRQPSQSFNKPKNIEAMPTYMLEKIIKKTKHVYKKYTKRDAVKGEKEKTRDEPKELNDEDQGEEVNFYKATRSDKPGDFLLHTRGLGGPTRGPEAATQTEIHLLTDSSSDEERERMQKLTPLERWEMCEKLREEQMARIKEKESKVPDDKEPKQDLQQQPIKLEQPVQDEKQHLPEQQEQQKLTEQKENIEKAPNVDENAPKAKKTPEKPKCVVPSTNATTTQKATTEKPAKPDIQENVESQGKPKRGGGQGDAQEIIGSQTPKTPEPKKMETPVYQEQTASVQNVLLQQKMPDFPEKTEAHVYLGKLFKLKKPKSVENVKIQSHPEPETQKLIDELEEKQDTPEIQKQLGTPEEENKSSPNDLTDPTTTPPVKKTRKNVLKRKLQENESKGKVNLFRNKVKKRENTSKLVKDKLLTPLPDGDGDEDVYTGLFESGARRTDLVLVTLANDTEHRENIKLGLLVGLVEMGVTVEAEVGLLPENQNIMFIKLYAPDDALYDYAAALKVQKYFQTSHENLINEKITLMDERFKLQHERELLKSVRRRYAPPLRYSNQERSYIVYMMLRHHSAVLGAGLDRLLNTRILLDVYALHDGPYYCPYQDEFYTFNCRQVLFLYWAGKDNIMKYQPMHMIYDYFGSKLAFYFLFYGFYNMALVFASIWGVFMTLVYLLKDHDHLSEIRGNACTSYQYDDPGAIERLLRSKTLLIGCFQCEGESDSRLCPRTTLQDRCADTRLMMFTDSPYMVSYSAGIALWALLLLTFWKRTERYWLWMWEENLTPKHQLYGTVGGTDSLKLHGFKKKNETKAHLAHQAINVLVSTGAVVVLLLLLFVVVVFVHASWVKPLAVTLWHKFQGQDPKFKPELNAKVNNCLEIFLLSLLAFVTLGILFVLEKVLHRVSWILTTLEEHLSFERFEKSLISKYFFYSFLYTSGLFVCFVWLKGTFHTGNPIDAWHVKLNITTPWRTYNLEENPLRNISRRAITLNCSIFSCFYEGVVVFVTTILFRDVLVRIATIIMSRERAPKEGEQRSERDAAVSTCEREHRLQPVTELQVIDDFNTLFVQLALVTLFAPLCPLAPLLALAINSYDMRSKASMYVMRRRRALLFRSVGIGYWNHVLKLICYAAPLFHALTWTRTEIFKKYLYENTGASNMHYKDFQKTPGFSTFEQNLQYFLHSQLMTTHTEYIQTYRYRIHSNINKDLVTYRLFDVSGIEEECVHYGGYYITTYLKNLKDEISDVWPDQWNFLGENYTGQSTGPLYYHFLFVKVVSVLLYLLVFAGVSVVVWLLVRGCPGTVARRQQRERVLRRLHQHRLTHLRRV